jgi:hypothetical protein
MGGTDNVERCGNESVAAHMKSWASRKEARGARMPRPSGSGTGGYRVKIPKLRVDILRDCPECGEPIFNDISYTCSVECGRLRVKRLKNIP